MSIAKYIIVGGVTGGMTTAARLRRNDEKSKIIVFEKGEYISYANCGLPYYIGNTIKTRSNLFVQLPEAFAKRFNLDIRVQSEVLKIDKEKKIISIKDILNNKEDGEDYDKLLLSPGAEPIKPPIPGIEHPNIFTLRNISDTDRIKAFVTTKQPRKVVIIGGGFIGLEMAENLYNWGITVSIVEMVNQVMNIIDFEMAAIVQRHLTTKGISLYLNDGVSAFADADDKINIKLNSGKELTADGIILSIGVKPDSKLAKETGLELGSRGGILVNEYMQTSDTNIYAVGDVIEVLNPIINKKMPIPLAGPANKQGRIAADNIVFGNCKKYSGTIGTAIAKVFDLTVATPGAAGKLLKAENIPHISSIIHPLSHAGYYPDAESMSIKIQFAPDSGKLYGAQIVGYDGVDKRIDVFASAILTGQTIYNLQEFEHAYAPPYSSAKDPVNMAAFAAENILTNKVRIVHWDDIANIVGETTVLLDVRTREEAKRGTIEGAINIPIDDLRERINELSQDKKIVVFCAVGFRGYLAARILIQNGFKEVYNLSGGYKTYEIAVRWMDKK